MKVVRTIGAALVGTGFMGALGTVGSEELGRISLREMAIGAAISMLIALVGWVLLSMPNYRRKRDD